MTALKQQEYEWLIGLPEGQEVAAQPDVNSPQRRGNTGSKAQKKADAIREILSSGVERIVLATTALILLSICVACCSYVIGRYVQIHAMQYDIFLQKQAVKSYQKQLDELIVKKESFMTLDELETYATTHLNMIKADESRKVVVEKTELTSKDSLIQMAEIPTYQADDHKGGLLLTLGLWLKNILAF